MKKRKKSAPKPDKIPGEVKYRAPKGEEGQRPLERIRLGKSPVEGAQPSNQRKR